MSTISIAPSNSRNAFLRPIAIGGAFIFFGQALHMWVVPVLIQKASSLMVAWQFIASGALGMAAFEGGMATAWLGVFFHLTFSFVIAGVFFLAFDRLPRLQRNLIAGSLLYGLGVFVVMNMIVTPLSAAPPLPVPALPWLIEAVLEHILLVGLPLGLLARRNVNDNA